LFGEHKIIMNKLSDTHPFRETYIVRLWREDEFQASWNGQVQHIATGEITAIRDIEDLLKFFQIQLGDKSEQSKLLTKLK